MKLRGGLLAVALGSLLWGFHAMLLHHAPDVFREPIEDMSYAWYVPVFSLYVLWTERDKIRRSVGSASVWGLLAVLPFLALGFLGVRGVQLRFEIVAFVGLLLTLTWAFFGRRTAGRVLFPVLFLLFCIPLTSFLDIVTVHLRILSSSVAYGVLKGFGVDVIQQGTMIGSASGSFAIDVAEPCSGLRSLFALMALTAAYAYFNQPTWIRRGILFAFSVPLAILGNVMRVLSICLVAACASSDFATGFYHDYSGFVIFFVAILLMIGIGEVLTKVCEAYRFGLPAKDEDADAAKPVAESGRRSLVVAVLAVVLVVPMMTFLAFTPKVTVCEPPDCHLVEIAGYTSEIGEPSEAELHILPKDTRIEKRLYTAPNGEWYLVSLVIGGKSKSSIHRPELCLQAQGFLMVNPHTLDVGDVDWRNIVLDGGGVRPSQSLSYTFFNQNGYRTASHTRRIFQDVLDRSLLNRIDRWAMLAVNASTTDDARLAEFLAKLREVIQ